MKKVISGIIGMASLTIISCGGLGGSTSGGDILGGIIGAVTSGGTVINTITSVIGLDKLTEQELVGTWTYDSPGCAFTSENLLAKAGGEVAASQIEQKIAPYYQTAGINSSNTVITFNADKTFKATVAGKSFSGKYTFDTSESKITLQALILNINCYAKREAGGISILFESKKLLTVLQTLATLSGNDTAKTIGDISKNYDGVRLGFDMKK
ncbi:MAG: DUF4923 family protein [Prevotella sp.]|nr:DUF4923 family protein [Prevotella sp.]